MFQRLLYRGPSLATLHEEYAKQKGTIDTAAPVRATAQVRIEAERDRVWHLLSAIDAWPQWHKEVTSARLADGVKVDGGFTWVNGRSTLHSTLAVVDPGRELTWSGSTMGIRAVHRNTLGELPGGGVLLHSEESMAAPLLGLIFTARKLQATLDDWVHQLKVEAERGADTAP